MGETGNKKQMLYINKSISIGKGTTKNIKLGVRQRILKWVLTLDRMVEKVSRRRWCLSLEGWQGDSHVNSQGKNHGNSQCKGPEVCGTFCELKLWTSFTHTLTGCLPFHASSCFSDAVLQYVWGLHLGPGWLCPFIYIHLKACWDSPLFHTSSQPVSYSMWFSHSIKTALGIYIILICLPTFFAQVLRD